VATPHMAPSQVLKRLHAMHSNTFQMESALFRHRIPTDGLEASWISAYIPGDC